MESSSSGAARNPEERGETFTDESSPSLCQTSNDLVRSTQTAKTALQIKPKHLGLLPGLSYDNIERLLETGEGELHR